MSRVKLHVLEVDVVVRTEEKGKSECKGYPLLSK